jgi:hypothetical protein
VAAQLAASPEGLSSMSEGVSYYKKKLIRGYISSLDIRDNVVDYMPSSFETDSLINRISPRSPKEQKAYTCKKDFVTLGGLTLEID